MRYIIETVMQAYLTVGCCVAVFALFRAIVDTRRYLKKAAMGKTGTVLCYASCSVPALVTVFLWPWYRHFFAQRKSQYDPENPGRIVAITLDGAIAENMEEFHSTQLGPLLPYAAEAIAEIRTWGCRVVIWTARDDLEYVRAYLDDRDIVVDGVNSNLLFAVVIDDRSVENFGGRFSWLETMKTLRAKLQPPRTKEIDDAQAWSCIFSRTVNKLKRLWAALASVK